jgi:membrane peptidoglycan carboxypeptidase
VVKRRSVSKKRLNIYSDIKHRRRRKKDAAYRRRAEYLATLPKHPVKRFFYRLHPKRVLSFWFSKRGLFMILKFSGLSILLIVLMVGGLFAFYRKDLDKIRPGELNKRVQTTVTTYTDRNGKELWVDKGSGNYKIAVDQDEIAKYMRQATVAIEDKEFYNHNGISISGIARAAINNSQSGSVQGGSTLTQQLVKQVFFADESQKRGFDGIPRKIKEVILSIEVERMYNKEQILTLYLNESPYGGRRNGVESASQTYFGKHAKNLTLAESALLAAIPNQPGLYDPYNAAGNKQLLNRQRLVLDNMVEQKYITRAQADAAKEVHILDKIKPVTNQYKDIKAPHFVQMVRNNLEEELGKATVGRGGLIVKTTLDLRVQNKLNKEMTNMFNSYIPAASGFSNGAAVVEDVRSGQIIAMMGSRNFNYPGYGQDNATESFIQPGSSIKPLVYAKLFEDRGKRNLNFGSGSILSDTRTDFNGYRPNNADRGFYGNINIRRSLGLSRNIPAIKAMQIVGVDETLKAIRQMGDTYYCTQGQEKQAGLSSAIGGCGTRMIDHVNAFTTLARLGVYKPQSSILEVKNSDGQILKKFEDTQKRILSQQSSYIIADILSDARASSGLGTHNALRNLNANGIKTAVKTGTSDIGGQAKDIWSVGYTPSLAMSVWLGNPDTRPLISGTSSIPIGILDPVLSYTTLLYRENNQNAHPGEWYRQPAGIQNIGGELYPSWFDKKYARTNSKLTFDRVSKKKATSCTPDAARIEIGVTKTIDPITNKPIYIAPDGYDATKDDDVHECSDDKPSVSGITVTDSLITVRVSKGTFDLDSMDVKVNGTVIASPNLSSSGVYKIPYNFKKSSTVSITVKDKGYYQGSASQQYSMTTTEPPVDD